MAPLASAGLKVTHAYSKLAVSLESAQQSIQSKRFEACDLKKGFFRPVVESSFRKTVGFSERYVVLTKMNGHQPQTRTRRIRQP
jgi:hypothetical protein